MGVAGYRRGRSPLAIVSHVVYALCGYGRGHASRALSVATALQRRGHRMTFAAGGPSAADLPGPVLPVPALQQVVLGNRVDLRATARANWPHARHSLETIDRLANALTESGADLVVADHEPFLPRAARRAGVPVVALSHQLVLTHTRVRVPFRYAPSAWGTRAGIALLEPPGETPAIVPSFFFPPLRAGRDATLVGPTLRDDVLNARPSRDGPVLVYLNEGTGMDAFLATLGAIGVRAVVYGAPRGAVAPPGVVLRPPGRAAFLHDLARARAVVATAGFTLLSEALHLGKPILALPNRGFFEQTVNALYLERLGRGEAVHRRAVRPADLAGFLSRADRYAAAPGERAAGEAGREASADRIEAALAAPRSRPVPASALAAWALTRERAQARERAGAASPLF